MTPRGVGRGEEKCVHEHEIARSQIVREYSPNIPKCAVHICIVLRLPTVITLCLLEAFLVSIVRPHGGCFRPIYSRSGLVFADNSTSSLPIMAPLSLSNTERRSGCLFIRCRRMKTFASRRRHKTVFAAFLCFEDFFLPTASFSPKLPTAEGKRST